MSYWCRHKQTGFPLTRKRQALPVRVARIAFWAVIVLAIFWYALRPSP